MLTSSYFIFSHILLLLESSAQTRFIITLWQGIHQLQTAEWIAAILSLWCVVLAAKNSIWNWPVAMAGSMIYVLLFLKWGLFSDAVLNAIFVGFQLYGWINWHKNSLISGRFSPMIAPKNDLYKLFILSLVIYPIWVYIVDSGMFSKVLVFLIEGGNFSGDLALMKNIPIAPKFVYIDAMLLIMSLSALYMQSKKWIQHWLLWILIDVIYVPVYWLNQNYITSLLYLIYIPIAFKGYQMWMKESRVIPPEGRSTDD